MIKNKRKKYSYGQCYDTRDYYRSFKKKHRDIDMGEVLFRKILVDLIQSVINDRLMKYERVAFPCKIGELYVEDVECGFVKRKDGSIMKRNLVDWPKTWEMHKHDPTLLKRHIYVYQDLKSYAKLRYRSNSEMFAFNVKWYDMLPCTDLADSIYHRLTLNDKNWKRGKNG